MSIAQDILALQARFVATFVPLRPSLMIIYDNESASAPIVTEPFVRFTVRPGASARESYVVGSARYQQLGRVWIQVFVPRGTGSGLAIAIADDASNTFRTWKDATGLLRCGAPVINTIPPTDDEPWLQVSVNVPYEAQRIY